MPGEEGGVPGQGLALQGQAGQRGFEVGRALEPRAELGQDQRVDHQRRLFAQVRQLLDRPVGPLWVVCQHVDEHIAVDQRGGVVEIAGVWLGNAGDVLSHAGTA